MYFENGMRNLVSIKLVDLKKKILFILPTLTAGGAERVISFIAQNIDRKKYEPLLLVIGHEKDSAYDISGIPLFFLNKERLLYAIPSLFAKLKEINPRIVLSSIGHLNTILGLMSPLFPKTKFIIREASVISSIGNFASKKSSLKRLSKLAYSWVDGVICQSQDMAEDFYNLFKIPPHKIFVINNPITQKEIPPIKESENYSYTFITVGRLSKEKGHLRILDILANLNEDFRYLIIGDGPERKIIFDYAKKIGIDSKIKHIPYTDNVFQYLRKSLLFLQGSYVEGFPNAVLESCIVGTPVLAFNVPGGTKEIIVHEENGFLVDNENLYLAYLKKRPFLNPQKVRESVMVKFDKDVIISRYENLIENILE